MKKSIPLSFCLLLVVTTLTFHPVLRNSFVNFDDNLLVTGNAAIKSLSTDNILNMFSSPFLGLYHPLTLLSWAVEFRAVGLYAPLFHLTNLLLHVLNTLSVFWLMFLLTGRLWSALPAALLFGVHPLHVESVAWISERKDVLYAFFFLGAMAGHVSYLESGKKKYYFLSLSLFAASLLSKPMAVTLPLALILIDHVRGRDRIVPALREKIPFFLLSLGFALLTVALHNDGAVRGHFQPLSLVSNIPIAVLQTFFYISRLIVPHDLSCLYPGSDRYDFFAGQMAEIIALPALVCLLAALLYRRNVPGRRTIIFGGLFFLVTLLPAANLVPFGLGIAADRHTYIPALGLFVIAGEGFAWMLSRLPGRRGTGVAVLLLCAVTGTFAWLAWQRCHVWRDSITLWSDVLRKYPGAVLAYNNRGAAYLRAGEHRRALEDFDRVLRLVPGERDALINRGNVFLEKGDVDGALRSYQLALSAGARSPEIYMNCGNAYKRKKEYGRAIAFYDHALRLNPRFASAYFNRGVSYLILREYDKALSDFLHAQQYAPDHETAYALGEIYRLRKEYRFAIRAYSQALVFDRGYAPAYHGRAEAYAADGEYDRAVADYTSALSIVPQYAEAYRQRAAILERAGRGRNSGQE